MESSRILKLKSKFFLYRAVSYFSFLFIPIWIPKALSLSSASQFGILLLYVGFLVGQWYLLGKEIDHRLKIYYKVNSSIDRIVYRFYMGMFFFIFYFNLLAFLPAKWIYNTFWITWAILGLFYSWPTRGKIIEDSVSTNFTEYRYLDSFEKTLVILIFLFFILSFPELPPLQNFEALKLYFDPPENLSHYFWDFVLVNYFPFKKYPDLFKLSIGIHFYVVIAGLLLLNLYAFLRYFFSRRLSLLGLFAFLSSWSFSKLLATNQGIALDAGFTVLWVWSLFWVAKSATYRAGLFLGLVTFWGTVINYQYISLILFQLMILNFLMLNDKTQWFKKQTLRYSSFGFFMAFVIFYDRLTSETIVGILKSFSIEDLYQLLDRKAFFCLSIFGAILSIFYLATPRLGWFQSIRFERQRLVEFIICISSLLIGALLINNDLMNAMSLMWIITFVSLIPIEFVFQSISRMRSRRNFIYLLYIMICILDSHFEGRVKIFLRLFDS